MTELHAQQENMTLAQLRGSDCGESILKKQFYVIEFESFNKIGERLLD